MFAIILDFFKREYRDQYFSKWVWISSILGSSLSLAFYWFTSKAFGSRFASLDGSEMDYFTFILVGENALLIPLALMNSFTQSIRTVADDGVLDVMLISQRSFFKSILFMGAMNLSFHFLQMTITLTFAALIFGLQIHYTAIPSYLVLLAFSLPLYIGLGLINTAFIVLVRRGVNFFVTFSVVLSMLSGTYFPIGVFPSWIQKISLILPYTFFLNLSRELLAGKIGLLEIGPQILLMLLVGSGIFYLGRRFFQFSIEKYRLRGDPKLFWK